QKIGEFKQYGRNSIIWDNFRKAAAFVTSQNRTLRQFARTLIAQSGVENDNLVTAMWLFEALRVKGVRFMPDELTNWIRLPNGNLYSEDRIQFPSNLLLSEEKAGDCDDLTALYCSLLAQVGIETSLIDAPKHIFMMLDTGIPSLNSSLFPVEPGYFVKQDGRLWIPIEITDIASNFMQAWNKGREYYYLLKDVDGQVYTSNILEAWSVYPPLNFESDTTLSFSSQELRDIKTSVREDSLKFEKMRTRYVAERFGESIDKIADFQKLLERGLTLVGYGADSLTIQQARKAFQTVLDSLPNHPKALNNLGNIHFLQDSLEAAEAFYGQALSLSDTTLGIHLNLTQLYLRMIRESAVDSPDRAKYSQLFWDEISFLQKIIRTNEDVLAFFDAPTDTAKALNSRGAVGDLDFIEGEITKKISEELIWRQMFPEEDFKPGSFKKVIVELKVRPGEKYDLEDLVEASGKRGSEEESVKAKLNLASRNLTLEMVESDTMTVNLVRHTFRIGIVGEEKMKDVEFKFLLPVGVKINRSDPKYSVKRLLSRPAGRRAEKQVAMKTGYHLFWYK
ncbi:MAG: tetratricopeptide repeat protein, partial [bacterium]